jgi:hypothetical protein
MDSVYEDDNFSPCAISSVVTGLMTAREVMNTAMSRALTVFFWIMAFSVNDEIFYDHTVIKQPLIFKINQNSLTMSPPARQNAQGLRP